MSGVKDRGSDRWW